MSTPNSEFYRERIASDSLFAAPIQNQVNATPNSNLANSQSQDESHEDTSSAQQDDVFENEDLFGPPPLPKSDSKPVKSKVSSLFDDSDSGDELFSTTSSGSRSQKSTDFLTTAPQHPDKSKTSQRKGLFDEDIDIFGSKDSPDVDIFGIASKPILKENDNAPKKISGTDNGLFGSSIRDTKEKSNVEKRQNIAPKKISLFNDDEDIDDGDLFAVKPIKSEAKSGSLLFDDDGDLFSVKKGTDEKPASAKRLGTTGPRADDDDGDLFSVNTADRKEDKPGTTGLEVDKADRDTFARERKGSDILAGHRFFSSATDSHGLAYEDDDYDDLFNDKSVTAEKKEKEKPISETKEDTKVTTTAKDTGAVDSKLFAENREPSQDTDMSKVEQRSVNNTPQVASEETVARSTESEVKKSPPKSLDIQAAVTSSPPDDSQSGRRAVSGKIKNLMGKMGDLKILSPMDTPPMWRRSEERTDEEDSTADRDSDDGGCISTQGHSSPPSISGNVHYLHYAHVPF